MLTENLLYRLVFVAALQGCAKLEPPIQFKANVHPEEFFPANEDTDVRVKIVDFKPRQIFHDMFKIALIFTKDSDSPSKIRLMSTGFERTAVQFVQVCKGQPPFGNDTVVGNANLLLLDKEEELDYHPSPCWNQEIHFKFCKLDYSQSNWQLLPKISLMGDPIIRWPMYGGKVSDWNETQTATTESQDLGFDYEEQFVTVSDQLERE